jgi:hypothetical protein
MSDAPRSDRLVWVTLLAVPFVLLLFVWVAGIVTDVSGEPSDDRKGRTVSKGDEGDASPPVPLPDIDPSAPLADLLPAPPKGNKAPVYLGEDLAGVPELMLEAPPDGDLTTEQWRSRKAYAAAAALHLNGKEEDGFVKALLRSRADLAGLPFAMGDSCRTRRESAATFKKAAETARRQKGAALLGELPDDAAGEEEVQQLDGLT